MSHRAVQDEGVGENPPIEDLMNSRRLVSSYPQGDSTRNDVQPISSVAKTQRDRDPGPSSNSGARDESPLGQPQLRSSSPKSMLAKNTHVSSPAAAVEPTGHLNTATKTFAGSQATENDIPRIQASWSDRLFARKSWVHRSAYLRLRQLWEDFQHEARKTILRIQEMPASVDGRHILMNENNVLDERTGQPYINNAISSCRYSLWDFVPRQLYAQFSKLANFYFLVIGIMQMVPRLSTTGRFTTIVPLLVFIGISMAKEGWDDIRRWKLDQEENNRSVHVMEADDCSTGKSSVEDNISPSHPQSWITKKWLDVKVGDIVRLGRDEPVPADTILMYAQGGNAYMETMALDGETNLKVKQPPPPLLKNCTRLQDLSSCRGVVVVEDPSKDLYRFEGRISIVDESFPLTTAEVMHRGSTLRNTPIAAGIVCYTGEECRIRQNANKNPRTKAPALQRLVNKIVILIACFVLVLSLGCSFGYKVWDSYEEKAWYLRQADVYWGYIVTSFIIMFNTLLPLSLYVSMEIVKLCQIWLMSGDIDMYDPATNTPMECQTSTINEELGQISYIFSDKTGTLTRNEMKVKKLSCGGHVWDHEPGFDRSSKMTRFRKTRPPTKDESSSPSGSEVGTRTSRQSVEAATSIAISSGKVTRGVESASEQGSDPHFRYGWQSETRSTMSLMDYIYEQPFSPIAKNARSLILSIALCHTCLPERDGRSDRTKFQATSPDELALVTAAQDMGYLVMDRQSSEVKLEIFPRGEGFDPTYETYKVLQVIEFTSSRKRMSVIVREPDSRIRIHCKGADTVVHKLLHLSDLAARQIKSIEERVNRRKSLEAQEVIRRSSGACSDERASFGTLSRPDRKFSTTTSRTRAGSPSTEQKPASLVADTTSVPNSPPGPSSPSPALVGNQSIESFLSTQQEVRPLSRGEEGQMNIEIATSNRRIDDVLESNEEWVMERTFGHINQFANEGLRTLLHVARYLDEEEYREWALEYSEATTALSNREQRISDTANLIERQFELIGATAIEDKLQEGVPDAIERLRRANIKLWMLTGDKRETAVSISRSCQLAKPHSSFIILDHSAGDVLEEISGGLRDVSDGAVAHAVLVLDGETLASIQKNAEQQRIFLELAVLVDSVICCRASPNQKSMLVKSIRHQVDGAITLAIGDGANDVAMIQEADVGIGISGGKEGLQAARTSDYAIAQFRFLCKLLLVHGRYNYDRIGKYILATTYKEMLFYMTQALYQRSNGYTGTSLYENWSLAWYNALFTSLPVIFLGTFMSDLSEVTLLAVPELYSKGQRQGSFNFKIWLWWTFLASAEAMMVYFIMHSIYAEAVFTLDNGVYAMGVLTYTACVVIVNLKLQVLEIHNKNILVVIAIVLSLGVWFVWNLMISAVYGDNVIYNVKEGLLDRFGQNALWWLTLIVVVLLFLLFELAIKAMKAAFFPSDVDLYQVYEKDPGLRCRFEMSAAPLLYSPRDQRLGTLNSGEKSTATEDAQLEQLVDDHASQEQGTMEKPSSFSKNLAEGKNGPTTRSPYPVP